MTDFKMNVEAESAYQSACYYQMSGEFEKAAKSYVLALNRYERLLKRSQASAVGKNLAEMQETKILTQLNGIMVNHFRKPPMQLGGFSDLKAVFAKIPTSKRPDRTRRLQYPDLSHIVLENTQKEPVSTEKYPSVAKIPAVEPVKPPKQAKKAEFSLSDHVVKISDYSKVKSLGRGSFGSVYCAKHRVTGEKVAIKLLSTEFVSPDDQIAFLREVESLARASHPAVLKFRGFSLRASESDASPAIVTEYVPNGSLQDILDKKRHLTATEKMITVYGVAQAMRYLHDDLGMVHRDLKPANVMLNHNNEPVVGDFGLAKMMTKPKMRQSMVSGSPIYMAPELMEQKEYNTKVDVYAFAIMLYELLTETLAFDDITSVQKLVTDVCRGKRPPIPKTMNDTYRDLITKCWSDKANSRPSFRRICSWMEEGKLNLPGADLQAFRAYVEKTKQEPQSDQ